MSQDGFDSQATLGGVKDHIIRILGANGANPTKQVGQGVTVTRTGEGAYRITWAKNPGTFLGWSCNLGAATPGDIKGYTVIRDTWDSTNLRLDFVVYNSSFTAADIIADEYADIVVKFQAT